MKVYLHQTHHTIADFKSIEQTLTDELSQMRPGLHVYPEFFLCGYPLADLCLDRSFITRYQAMLSRINEFLCSLPYRQDCATIVGGPDYFHSADQSCHLKGKAGEFPVKIFNSAFLLVPGKPLFKIYDKQLLPNYDIFDERKYFTPGKNSCVLKILDKQIGIMICEDMWPSVGHDHDPTHDLVCDLEKGVFGVHELDLIVNLSASPFYLGKKSKRYDRGQEISKQLGVPFVYVNRVGAEDEILFDGASFVCHSQDTIFKLEQFKEQTACYEWQPSHKRPPEHRPINPTENNWDSLFVANWNRETSPPTLITWSEEQMEELFVSLGLGIQSYAQKCGFNNFSIALSGGMDSALVTAIVSLFLRPGQYMEAIYMPGLYSASLSYDASFKMCQNLKIPFSTLPIKFIHKSIGMLFKDSFGGALESLADENIQSRLRGAFLYTRSNQINSMVLNTSNKSEIAVGYSTQYGDSVGALSVLGDLYKTEVYQLANYLNKKYPGLIPEEIIQRPPSAELRQNQEDSHSLPPYERLDAILEGILSYRYNVDDLIKLGFNQEEVYKSFTLYQRSEYKRFQFCPIIKVKSKSFGFGHRVPICKARMID